MKVEVARVLIKTPIDLVKAGEDLGNAWFRGQGSDKWRLESTLERDAMNFKVPRECIWERENVMLGLFKKRMHLYDEISQQPTSEFEWFALIRHYGGPSRLLDVSTSYLVAAYFALSDSQPKRDAVIWAFRDCEIESATPNDYDSLFCSSSQAGLKVADPGRLNDRMHAQSGSFFVPGSISTSLESQVEVKFNTDLTKTTKYRSIKHINTSINHRVWQLVIPRASHSDIFRFVSRSNVRAYSLFSGLGGLAESLKEMMRAYD